jgi:DNA-binding YbaB/EbfC family protein
MGTLEITGTSGGGLVKVVIDGEHNVKKLTISPNCVDKEEVEALEDLIVAAFKDAAEKLKAQGEGSQPFFGL